MEDYILLWILLVAITPLVLILFRGVVLWYWGIKEIGRLLESIDEKLGVIIDTQSGNKPEVKMARASKNYHRNVYILLR